MTKTTIHANLSNSPRKEFIKDLNVAFASGNAAFIVEHVSDDMLWIIHGDQTHNGKEAFSSAVHKMKEYTADELVIHSIITHGREAASNGEMPMGGKKYVYCDIYKFTGTTGNTLKEMNSYVLEVK